MFVTRLEMIGFKSFASRTALEFRSGIMAVVGPNGCGKTNIVDAVRWALGEQRAGTLRADRMEAVIFNGTAHRRPLGMAEVTLTIDNDRGLLPSPYSEIAITRRLFRSGDSEYLINRNPCRLRELGDLFTDTGLGSSAYSIIELTMVDAIITGSSEARRALLEEAAGIARYRMRRSAAEKRLDATRENLLRVEDIYREVEKSYASLKRQAARARRYELLTRAIHLRLVADLAEDRLDLVRRRQPLEEKLEQLELENQQAEEVAARATSRLLSLEGRELSLIDRTTRTQDGLKRLDRREAEMEGELALARQRLEFLMSQIGQADSRRQDLKSVRSEAEEQHKATLAETEKLQFRAQEAETARADLEAESARTSAELERLNRKAAESRQAEDRARRELELCIEKSGAPAAERQRLSQQLQTLQGQRKTLDDRLQALTDELASIREERDGAAKELAAAEVRLKRASQVLDRARHTYSDALSNRARALAALEAAKSELETHRQRRSPDQLLPDKVRQVIDGEGLLPIAEQLECRPEHGKAVTAALRDLLECIERPSLELALRCLDGIKPGQQAVLRFPSDIAESPASMELPPERDGCIPGTQLVANSGELGGFLRRRLADLLLVPDLEALRRLAPWAAERRIRLVTLSGELLEPDGVLHAGVAVLAELQVAWPARLKELEEQQQTAAENLSRIEKAADAARKALTEAESNAAGWLGKFREAGDKLAVIERRLKGLEAEQEQLEQRCGENSQQSKQLRVEMGRYKLEKDESDRRKRLEKTLENAVAIRNKSEVELRNTEEQQRRTVERLAVAATEAARLGERLIAAERLVEQYAREMRTAEDSLASLEAGLADQASQRDQTAQAGENISAQLELLRREKEDVTASLEAIRLERASIRGEREETTAALNGAQQQQRALLKERSGIEAEVIALRERLRELDRRLEEHEFHPGSVHEHTQMEMIAELEQLGLAEVPVDRLRTRLQSIGPVNMLALEELKEVEQRYRFLSDQKKDLENGIEALEKTIDHINAEARRLYRETFEEVNRHFQEVFRTLFDGGEARLTLGEGDPLEADVRVWATPQGKKLAALSMLSGGEKALTAIALLFAIYKTRPSPFCILDEVDAPLDDANVVRFNSLLALYSRDTQFLVVTHNKRTMEAADCLYGVTLGEDGTSRLVSVKIEGGTEEGQEVAVNGGG